MMMLVPPTNVTWSMVCVPTHRLPLRDAATPTQIATTTTLVQRIIA